MEFWSPVNVIQAFDFCFRSARMDELVVADINADMGNARAVSVSEKYQIARFRRRNRCCFGKLRQCCTRYGFAILLIDVLDKSTAVKASRSRATETVRHAFKG